MNSSWIHGCTAKQTAPTNMMVVAKVKQFVEGLLEVPAVLIIERVGDRNRAAFRIALQDGVAEVEVKAAHLLMRHKRTKAWQLDSLMAIMEFLA